MAKGKSANKKGKNNISKNKTKKPTPKIETKTVKEEKPINEPNEFKRLLKIIIIVTAIFALFYAITLIVTKKADDVKQEQKNENKTSEKAEIQYENIMIGTMLNHDGTYYILIEGKDDNRLDEYNSLIEEIKSNDDAPNIYKANLTDSFNKVYLGKEENYYVDDISEFKVKTTTLIKVVDKKIDSAYDNYDAIKNKLTELA
ncbi:MAG: hypothetical protein IKG40_01630 [Bacilli bacterium]|nr:hypothetical protein [Bacilli bacterium]